MRTDKVSLGIIPHDLISFILEKPGDFCISANSMGSYELSIRSDKDKTFHLALEPIVKGYRIRSMLFATGATIGELIYNIRDSSFYRAHMLINGEFVDGTLKESRRMGTNEWRNHMFDLCRAIASVMSGFLNSDIYSGSVKLENFHVYFVDALPYGRIQLVFTDADDLIPVELVLRF
ncbi:unnamed protein product [Heligmosomoides polygyrus]|uniref:DUF4166 domain-containing protein n=1 Tax=Heligmosomoides polygyrus TaxID=6339 RepID=A0A183G8P1_HELPZ|nr:unnamed protein product [Heligmosomoides polygyrus]